LKRKVLLTALALAFLGVSVVASASLSFAVGETPPQEEQEKMRNFMQSMGWTDVTMFYDGGPENILKAIGQIGDVAVKAEVEFFQGVWLYRLKSFSTNLNILPSKTPEELSDTAKKAVKAYGETFNLTLFEEYANMIPQRIEENKMVEKRFISGDLDVTVALNVTSTKEEWDYYDYDSFKWIHYKLENLYELEWLYYKLGNYMLYPCRVFNLKIMTSGIITCFGRTGRYLASSVVNITEEDAIAKAKPYAEEYAQNYNRKIVSTEALLVLWNDPYCKRSNSSEALYPVWFINFEFDETIRLDSFEGVYGYHVNIWADNCEVYNYEPLFLGRGEDSINQPSSYAFLLIALPIGVVAVLLGVGIHKNRGKNRIINKAFSLLPNKLQQTLKKHSCR
jgi:hypothetical protein